MNSNEYNEFHAALKELFETRKSSDSGDKYTFPLDQVKKKLEIALEHIIDARIIAYNKRSQKRTGSSFVSMPAPKPETNENIITMMDALNSCPVPPENMKWFVGENLISWMRAYFDWYNEKRSRALKSKE